MNQHEPTTGLRDACICAHPHCSTSYLQTIGAGAMKIPLQQKLIPHTNQTNQNCCPIYIYIYTFQVYICLYGSTQLMSIQHALSTPPLHPTWLSGHAALEVSRYQSRPEGVTGFSKPHGKGSRRGLRKHGVIIQAMNLLHDRHLLPYEPCHVLQSYRIGLTRSTHKYL